MFVKFTIFIIKFETSIIETDSNQITGSLGMWDPIMINCYGIEIHPLCGLIGIGIPFIDEIVFSNACIGIESYLVSSLKEHQEVEVQNS